MNGDPRVPYNPYHDWLVPAGRDAFARLFNTEVYFMAETYSKNTAYKLFRRSAVEFIENQSRSWNFDALIPYMAMTYFDRFLFNGKIPLVVAPRVANINLFLICCLTIAWKLRTKTFVLSSFLNERNIQYSAKNVLDMELHICKHLDWRMRTLTPFCFLEFFIPFLNLPPDVPSPLRSVRQLIVKSQFDIAFTEFRPSVLAASAMLTVSAKMFPAQFRLFETHIITSEFINPVMDMVYKCNKMLAPLYGDPSTPAAREDPGEASSSSVARKRSDPIPIPVAGGRQTEMSEEQWLASVPPDHANVEEERPIRRAGKEPANEEGWIRREGKEPAAASEIHQEPKERHKLVQADDSDELMNFRLGWIEAQADSDRRSVAAADRDRRRMHAGFCTYLVQRLTGCCSNFAQGCSIL